MIAFVDGMFELFKIVQKENEAYPLNYLKNMRTKLCFKELGVGDSLKSQLHQSSVEVETKIQIPQFQEIDSQCVVKINNKYYHVYNAYHFRDEKEDIPLTNLTLEGYDDEIRFV